MMTIRTLYYIAITALIAIMAFLLIACGTNQPAETTDELPTVRVSSTGNRLIAEPIQETRLRVSENLCENAKTETETEAKTEEEEATMFGEGYSEDFIEVPGLEYGTITPDIPKERCEEDDVNDLDEEWYAYVRARCEDTGVPYALVMAIIEHESGFDSRAVSATNDYGLMQINRINHQRMREILGEDWDPLDPYDNVDAGLEMLEPLWHSFEGDYDAVLMCYQYGNTGAAKLWAQGIYESEASKDIQSRMVNYLD